MYIPEFPTLSPRYLTVRNSEETRLPFPLAEARAHYFYFARSGIYHAFRQMRQTERDTVLVPDYHHGNEIHAILAAGWKVKYYHIQWDLSLCLDELEELLDPNVRAVLAIHYMGWPQKISQLRAFCDKKGLWLFEDCALAFLTEAEGSPVGTTGDFSVFCLYKSLPVPNGAVLAGRILQQAELGAEIVSPGGLNTLARSSQLWFDWLRLKFGKRLIILDDLKQAIGSILSRLHVQRTAVGDAGFDVGRAGLGMSPFFRKVLRGFNYSEIRRARRRNFETLNEFFDGRVQSVFSSLDDGACPLFYPLIVTDKSRFIAKMREKGIGAVPFWNQGHPSVQGLEGEPCKFFRRHVAELPLHQDLNRKHMKYIAAIVLQQRELLMQGETQAI